MAEISASACCDDVNAGSCWVVQGSGILSYGDRYLSGVEFASMRNGKILI